MAFDFPATPSDGQKFTPSGGPTYIWVAATSAWKIQGSIGASGNAYVSDTPPLSPQPGQFWWESDTGNMFMWFDDGDSQQWVQVNVPNVAGLATSQARNRICNPGMQHSQENGTTTVSANGAYPADQWQLQFNGLASFATQVPSNDPGFGPCYLGMSGPTTAKPSLAATDFVMVQQYIEGRRIYDFYWGQPAAKPIVIQFNANASVAGTYALSIRNTAATRSYIVPLALTPTGKHFVVPIPGCIDGVWPNDNSSGMSISIVGAAGTTYQTTPNQWMPGNFLGFAGMSNLANTASQSIALGQVGLYLDPDGSGIPPVWECPDFTEELFACMRYWEKVPITVSTTNDLTNTCWFKTRKRVAPTLNLIVGTAAGATFGPIAQDAGQGCRQVAASSALSDGALACNARM